MGVFAAAQPSLTFQNVAAQLSRVLGAADHSTLDAAVETCLEAIGEYASVDVAFATLVDESECVSDDWHWIRPGRVAHAPVIGSPLSATFGSATEFLRLGHSVVVNDLLQIELAPSERALATANGLRAIVISPVIVDAQLLGVVGLQMFDRPREWESGTAGQVEVMAQLLVQAVVRCRHRGALAVANMRARRIAEYIPDGLALLDVGGTIVWVSPSLVRQHGVAAEHLVGTQMHRLFHPDHRDQLRHHVSTVGAEHETVLSAQMRAPDGQWRWTDLALRLASEPDSEVPDEIVMTVRDSHERHLREAQLTRRSEIDQLTGLLNRAAFEARIGELAGRDAQVAIAYCDLDEFKTINDTYGHHSGDDALRAAACALRNSIRPHDVVARIGGDEFAIVFTDVDSSWEAECLGERLLERVTGTQLGQMSLSMSVGICGPGPAGRATALSRIADQAMYDAKRQGKARSVYRRWTRAIKTDQERP